MGSGEWKMREAGLSAGLSEADRPEMIGSAGSSSRIIK